MAKLDPVKISWIIRQKQKGAPNKTIAEAMNVSQRWVQVLWSRYRKDRIIPLLKRPGKRPVPTTEDEKNLTYKAWRENDAPCAVIPERILDSKYARHIPHNRIHTVLKSMGLASDEPKKQKKKKWIRYERTYSNSLWHTDWKYLEGMGWLIAYLDDASRFVVSYGLFDSATSENAVKVLKEAIQKYGRPAT
ncbi:MAG: DDE-type integrase/transposase/recombinase, partial [Candidatus Nitrosotenuis sp.]